MDSKLTLKIFQKQDSALLITLLDELFDGRDAEPHANFIACLLKDPENIVYLVTSENKCAGYIHGYRCCDPDCRGDGVRTAIYVNDAFVSKDYRNCGIFKKMKTKIMEHAQEVGLKRVFSDVPLKYNFCIRANRSLGLNESLKGDFIRFYRYFS